MHNVKIFYVIGDSFAWGSELGEEHTADANHIFTEYKKAHVYSSILAKKLKIPNYINASAPGASNERTYRILIKDLSKILLEYEPNEIFVNISLTSAHRREFCDNLGKYYLHLNAHEPPKESLQYTLWKTLVKDFNNDEAHYVYDINTTLAMQNFLKVNKIPYLFTSSMRAEREEYHYYQKFIPNFLYMSLLSDKRYHVLPSFQTNSALNKVPVGKYFHPLEDGHKFWSEYLYTFITNNNLLSVEEFV